MAKKTIIILVVPIALIIVATSAYFLFFQKSAPTIDNPTPQAQDEKFVLLSAETIQIGHSSLLSTDGWETYKESGFEFRYPKEWGMKTDCINCRGVFSSSGTADNPWYGIRGPDAKPWSRISTTIYSSDGLSLVEWLKKESSKPSTMGHVGYVFNNVRIGDNLFIGGDQFGAPGSAKDAYFDLGNGKILRFSFILTTDDKGFSNIFYTMLSTVKVDNVK